MVTTSEFFFQIASHLHKIGYETDRLKLNAGETVKSDSKYHTNILKLVWQLIIVNSQASWAHISGKS